MRDAERLLSKEMVSFMRKRGYSFEAHYIDAILNWRRSSDERGLTQLERSRFNYQMLNYLLDELMPWHKDCYDFSTLEVNRYIYTCSLGSHKMKASALTTYAVPSTALSILLTLAQYIPCTPGSCVN